MTLAATSLPSSVAAASPSGPTGVRVNGADEVVGTTMTEDDPLVAIV